MPKTAFTYRQLDERLRTLGFSVRTQKGKARIYRPSDGRQCHPPGRPLRSRSLAAPSGRGAALQEYDLESLEMDKTSR